MVIPSVLFGKSGRAMYCCKTVKYFLQFRGVRTYIEYIHVDTVLLCISRSIRKSGVEYRGSLIDKEQRRTNFLVVYTYSGVDRITETHTDKNRHLLAVIDSHQGQIPGFQAQSQPA